MLKLVRLARRRLLHNELLSQGANAASAALLAFILLLLLGTQVLSWHWLVLIPLAAASVGLYRVARRLPSPYVVAQIVDHRLDLADSISTALFFSQGAPANRGSAEMRRLQYERADRLSQSIDARKAVPYTVPRSLYLAAALVLVASSLFALRYGLNRRLDLRPPLASMLQQNFGFNQRHDQAKASPKKLPPEAQAPQEPNGDAIEDQAQQPGDRPDDAANAADEANESSAQNGDSRKSAADSKKQGDEGAKADSDDESNGDDGAEGDDAANPQGNGKQDEKQDSAAKQDANNANENSSLMSKVKDAFQNLISRMKPQQGQQGAQQSVPDPKGNQGKNQQNGSKQQSAKNGQQQNGGQQGDAQEGDAGEQAQNQQDAQGKGTGKSDAPQPSKQPGSGIGSQDGDKSIKQAEQLAAMGKISEILGKRSATVTGESTVEVQNTSQQLHTPYAQRGVQHSQGGAEINRDEVPVALQSYVEQYFEQVRKQAAPPGAPAKK
ncbi:MAG TPA: hypothetical protein VE959_01365 [Bryobacteraceae bacterium]|nr:hypothetical protein [Bryobacteraceae bacterium]